MMHQWVAKGSIDNARRPGRESIMRPTINEESDCLRKKNLRRRRAKPWRGKFFFRRQSGTVLLSHCMPRSYLYHHGILIYQSIYY